MRKWRYGRLSYSRGLDLWECCTSAGERVPIRHGDKVDLGSIMGVQIYAVLLRDNNGAWNWAVTEIPMTPVDGAFISVAVPLEQDQ